MRKMVMVVISVILAAAGLVPASASAQVPGPGDPGVRVAKFIVGSTSYTVDGTRRRWTPLRSSRMAEPTSLCVISRLRWA
ncbi:MAG: hypothetical protein AB1426_03655 [Bacillota bacterium]